MSVKCWTCERPLPVKFMTCRGPQQHTFCDSCPPKTENVCDLCGCTFKGTSSEEAKIRETPTRPQGGGTMSTTVAPDDELRCTCKASHRGTPTGHKTDPCQAACFGRRASNGQGRPPKLTCALCLRHCRDQPNHNPDDEEAVVLDTIGSPILRSMAPKRELRERPPLSHAVVSHTVSRRLLSSAPAA